MVETKRSPAMAQRFTLGCAALLVVALFMSIGQGLGAEARVAVQALRQSVAVRSQYLRRNATPFSEVSPNLQLAAEVLRGIALEVPNSDVVALLSDWLAPRPGSRQVEQSWATPPAILRDNGATDCARARSPPLERRNI